MFVGWMKLVVITDKNIPEEFSTTFYRIHNKLSEIIEEAIYVITMPRNLNKLLAHLKQ